MGQRRANYRRNDRLVHKAQKSDIKSWNKKVRDSIIALGDSNPQSIFPSYDIYSKPASKEERFYIEHFNDAPPSPLLESHRMIFIDMSTNNIINEVKS